MIGEKANRSRELTRPPTAYVEDEGEWLLEADTAGDDE